MRNLTEEGSTAKIFLGLSSASLISLGQLCDDDCRIFLDKKILIAVKEEVILLEENQTFNDGLWDILVYKNMYPKIVIE